MTRKRLILIIAGVLAAVAVVTLVIVNSLIVKPLGEPDPTRTPGGIITTGTATPTPTITPDPEHNHGNSDALGKETSTFDEAKPAYAKATEEFLTQYLQWDSEESAEDRAKRIAPYVAPDSPLLTRTPGISLVDKNPIYDYKSQTSVVGLIGAYTSWTLPKDATGNQLFMSAMGDYEIAQQASAGSLNTYWQASGNWIVQFEDWDGHSDPVIIDIREPDYVP